MGEILREMIARLNLRELEETIFVIVLVSVLVLVTGISVVTTGVRVSIGAEEV